MANGASAAGASISTTPALGRPPVRNGTSKSSSEGLCDDVGRDLHLRWRQLDLGLGPDPCLEHETVLVIRVGLRREVRNVPLRLAGEGLLHGIGGGRGGLDPCEGFGVLGDSNRRRTPLPSPFDSMTSSSA